MLPQLKVASSGHYLQTSAGEPFFYLADTCWELFHRMDRQEAAFYLADRASKGFNAIQAVALAESDGLRSPNAYGHLPLVEKAPTRPNEAYFAHVDWIIHEAARNGLYIGLLPTWGDKWNQMGGSGPEIFTVENARVYGEWLGRRYKDAPVIWMLGGDRNPATEAHRDLIRAMAAGIRAGDGGTHLMTYHTAGDAGSAQFFHDEPWLDFNSRQNGHEVDFLRYGRTEDDYRRTPVKPVIDIEPIYEDIPIHLDCEAPVYSNAYDVRRAFYWDVFSGACGHTYGHHSIWQLFQEGRGPKLAPIMSWREGVVRPGDAQMGIGRRLLESRPWWDFQPATDLLVPDATTPGRGAARIVATRHRAGDCAMIYVPQGRPVTVDLRRLGCGFVRVWLFDPRSGDARPRGEFKADCVRTFQPPHPGEHIDWIIILDDATREWPIPATQPC